MFHSPVITGEGAEPSPIRLRVLSLGAGVQSTTLALMAAHGEGGPMPVARFLPTPIGTRGRLRSSRMADVAQRAAFPGPYCLGQQYPRAADCCGVGQSLGLDPGICKKRHTRRFRGCRLR